MEDDADADGGAETTDDAPFVTAQGSINITDLFGIGAVAKSPAALKLIGELTTVLTHPLRTFLTGRAETKVEAKRRKELAKADQEVALIRSETSALVERMGRRFVGEQLLKQSNLETTISIAVNELNKHENEAPRHLDHTWLLRWTSGAQFASSGEIQALWAKILASKSSAEREDVSHSALTILEHLDGQTAKVMQEVAELMMVYGAVPWYGNIKPQNIDFAQIALLKEVGVFQEASYRAFIFKDFHLKMSTSGLSLTLHHTALVLTQRGMQLAKALFENGEFHSFLERKYDDSTRATTLMQYIRALVIEREGDPVSLIFNNEKGVPAATLSVKDGPTLISRNAEELIEDITKRGGKVNNTARILIGILKAEYQASYVSPVE